MRDALEIGYRLVEELLLHPDDRSPANADELGRFATRLPEVGAKLRSFLGEPAAASADEYLETFEICAPVPLYLGAYLFEEPESCRGAALSERNGYMISLRGIYRHFGLDLSAKELPDFLPLMVDFLRLSHSRSARKAAAIRRYFVEEYVHPALPRLRSSLEARKSVYARVIEALEDLVRFDLTETGDAVAWSPSEVEAGEAASSPMTAPGASGRSAPVRGLEGEPHY